MAEPQDKTDDTIIDLDASSVIDDVKPHYETAAVTPTPTRGKRSGVMLALAAVLVGAAAGGWLYRDVLSAYFPSNQSLALQEKLLLVEQSNASLREQVAALDKLAAQLKGDVDALEAKDAALSTLAQDAQQAQAADQDKFSSLESALADTRKAVAALATQPAPAASGETALDTGVLTLLQQRLDGLEKDVATLKAAPDAAKQDTALLSKSLADLKAKFAAGTGFADELVRIRQLVPAAPGFDVLQQHAALGLPDAKGLSQELKALIPDLPKPIIPGPVPESEGWWAAILDSLSGLVTIKVEGDVDWPTAASAAAALAESGDLPQAIEQLNKIDAEKPPGIRQWIERAQARLASETALQAAEDAVLRAIAARG